MSLNGLDDVPWSALTHAYGSAADVPALIRSLASSDDVERRDAYDELYTNIWHQGTVYEATIHVLPFLVELLRDPSTPNRGTLADLVASIITGISPPRALWEIPGAINPFTKEPIAKPADAEDRMAKGRNSFRKSGGAGKRRLTCSCLFSRTSTVHQADDGQRTRPLSLWGGRPHTRAAGCSHGRGGPGGP